MIKDLSVGYLTLVVSGIIFVIGSIFLLRNLIRDTGGNCFADFNIIDKLKNYFRIPCDYIWSFIGLTDPCCEITSYTVTTYSDGSTSSTKSCVECWNLFMLIVKRVVFFISTMFFYCFLIFLTVIFLIIKAITQIKCKSNNQNVNSNVPQNSDLNSNDKNLGNQPNLKNNRISPIEQKQNSIEQLENQNYIIKNQVQSPNHSLDGRLNVNNKNNNQITKLTIKDVNDNNLPAAEVQHQSNEIINIKRKNN